MLPGGGDYFTFSSISGQARTTYRDILKFGDISKVTLQVRVIHKVIWGPFSCSPFSLCYQYKNSWIKVGYSNLALACLDLAYLFKSKVMRCSRYGNWGRMHVILNGIPLEEVNCFKYLRSQVAADGGCEPDVVRRMNEGYRAC